MKTSSILLLVPFFLSASAFAYGAGSYSNSQLDYPNQRVQRRSIESDLRHRDNVQLLRRASALRALKLRRRGNTTSQPQGKLTAEQHLQKETAAHGKLCDASDELAGNRAIDPKIKEPKLAQISSKIVHHRKQMNNIGQAQSALTAGDETKHNEIMKQVHEDGIKHHTIRIKTDRLSEEEHNEHQGHIDRHTAALKEMGH